MDIVNLTAPCGLACFLCSLYRANEDHELREETAKELNLPIEKAACKGCRNERGVMSFLGLSEACPIYRCTNEKGVSFCCECHDFPCDHLQPYADKAAEVPHNTKLFNLCLIKKIGLEPWAKEQAARVKETYFKRKFFGSWDLE